MTLTSTFDRRVQTMTSHDITVFFCCGEVQFKLLRTEANVSERVRPTPYRRGLGWRRFAIYRCRKSPGTCSPQQREIFQKVRQHTRSIIDSRVSLYYLWFHLPLVNHLGILGQVLLVCCPPFRRDCLAGTGSCDSRSGIIYQKTR